MIDIALKFGPTICGIDELASFTPLAATHVLSILDPSEPVPQAFSAFAAHKRLELRFDDVVDETEGKQVPQENDIVQILDFGRGLAEADVLLVHCHAGVSRSTAAMALILAQAWGDQPADVILTTIHGLREKAWPNIRMIEIGDRLLGRSGGLIQATHALHSLQLVRRPHLAEYMENAGRSREVRAALATPPAAPGK